MEFTDIIAQRRSCRAFASTPVDRGVLSALIEAATLAPSASNVQAWRFCVVDDEALVRKLDMVSPGLSGKPPVIIVALTDRAYARAKGGQDAADEFATLDCAYACENLMLAATNAGLGTCAIKSYNDAAVRALIDAPDDFVVELLISVGYPDQAKPPRAPRRKPLDEVCVFNGYNVANGGEQSNTQATPELELLAYMITSAAGLSGEPSIYGPLRLIESAKRIASMQVEALDQEDPERAAKLRHLVQLIDERQNDCMTNEASFYAMLDDAAALLADLL